MKKKYHDYEIVPYSKLRRALGLTLRSVQIAIREYHCITLSLNRELIGGAPAARFTERLKELVESDYGLYESDVEHVGSLSG